MGTCQRMSPRQTRRPPAILPNQYTGRAITTATVYTEGRLDIITTFVTANYYIHTSSCLVVE
jgi:hypothetical protein